MRFTLRHLCRLAGTLLLAAEAVQAATYPLPPVGESLIGEIVVLPGERRDTLSDVARRYNVGWDAIRQANPGVDAWMIGSDVPVMLPTQYILPSAPREGIILNIAEMRVYYYPPGGRQVITYPASIGRMDWRTPLGPTTIARKQADPVWNPPASIKREHAEKGDFLPDTVPAGDDNPLGRHALYLGKSGYLIHGTNRPYGIGMRVTHGCIRLYPEDVEDLFRRAPVGTRVLMMDQPFKAGWKDNVLYVEAHPAFDEEGEPRPHGDISAVRRVVNDAVAGQPHSPIDWTEIEAIARQSNGMPTATSVTRTRVSTAAPTAATPSVPTPPRAASARPTAARTTTR
jgi:L,D-transpeptidase ErfK/SrfK